MWLYDIEGRRHLDFPSAYSAVNQGHCHLRILRSMNAQGQYLTTASTAFDNGRPGLLCKAMSDLTGYEGTPPMNSGAEAAETAMKVARDPQRAQHDVALRQWRQP